MTTGVLAALVQFLGLVRWPFLVPYLARADADADASPARREAIDIVFQSFHRYLGVAVGEHLGYLFTGAWSALTGVALMQATNTPWWLGLAGVVVGGLLTICSFEFVGAFEAEGLAAGRRPDPHRVRRLVPMADRHRSCPAPIVMTLDHRKRSAFGTPSADEPTLESESAGRETAQLTVRAAESTPAPRASTDFRTSGSCDMRKSAPRSCVVPTSAEIWVDSRFVERRKEPCSAARKAHGERRPENCGEQR